MRLELLWRRRGTGSGTVGGAGIVSWCTSRGRVECELVRVRILEREPRDESDLVYISGVASREYGGAS